MPLRNQKPHRCVPEGLTDAVDGSEAFKGAMYSMQNLIRQVSTHGVLVPRPALTQLANLPDFASGPVTDLEAIGNIVYLMYASATFPGKDRPAVYNLTTGVFTPITGLATSNLPTSQPTTGDWVPPTAAVVAGRVIFTHPGFSGGVTTSPYFNSFFGNIASGSPLIAGVPASLQGFLQVGMQLFATGIPAATTISAISSPVVYTTATGTNGTPTITVASAVGIAIDQVITGPGIPSGPPTIVTNIVGTTITLSANLGQTLSGAAVTFTGMIVTMSANATATTNMLSIFVVSAATLKFGWLDISGLTLTTNANTTSGLPILTGNPTIVGVQPGMTIAGTGIPAGATVAQVNAVVSTISCTFSSGVNTVTLNAGSSASLLVVGNTVAGAGIPIGTSITSVAVNLSTGVVTVTLNQNTTGAGPANLTFAGAIIVMSANATASNNGITITIAGGTPAAPQWGAGDLNINPIASTTPAIFAAQFNNRAWFGVNTPTTSGVQASDSGAAGTQTNASQTLLFQDGVPVTAGVGLALFNQLGGIIQSLMVFQDSANIRQITGDFSTANISVNALLTATGTRAPNSIASTPKGLMFVAPDGVRLIDFDARVSDPIGTAGKGLSQPFINAVSPSRISASYALDVYRVTLTWQPPPSIAAIWGAAQRTDEFWYHISLDRWSGPHTSTLDASGPYASQNSFVVAPRNARGVLYRSDPQPLNSSTYTEFGAQLSCIYQTVLLPDNPEQMAIFVVESSIFVALTSGSENILVTAIDDMGQTLDQAYVWIGPLSTPAQRAVPWHNPLTFRQLMVNLTMGATPQLQLGALNLRYQILGYQMPYPMPLEFILNQSILGGADVPGP